jgi:hypothetical protein
MRSSKSASRCGRAVDRALAAVVRGVRERAASRMGLASAKSRGGKLRITRITPIKATDYTEVGANAESPLRLFAVAGRFDARCRGRCVIRDLHPYNPCYGLAFRPMNGFDETRGRIFLSTNESAAAASLAARPRPG